MPEANQYVFAYKELVEMMIKKSGLHEGKWMLLANFGFAAINSGPSPNEIVPTAVAALQSIGIQKAIPDSPPGLVVDAAEVNPRVDTKSKKKRV
jgi:hypothetical protein